MRLASLAKLTSTEAATVDDTPEILQRLDEAMRRLRGGAVTKAEEPPSAQEGTIVAMQSANAEAAMLRKNITCFVELMSQRALVLSDLSETVRRVTEAAANQIGCERVSVWLLDDKQTKITCADLFVRATRAHSSGTELHAKDFAPYFQALVSERTIAAGDAHRDPRTSCFSESYLMPLGISAMLDVPIWVGEKMVGVICHEHVGTKRKWNSDEESFAYLMSTFVALAMERRTSK